MTKPTAADIAELRGLTLAAIALFDQALANVNDIQPALTEALDKALAKVNDFRDCPYDADLLAVATSLSSIESGLAGPAAEMAERRQRAARALAALDRVVVDDPGNT